MDKPSRMLACLYGMAVGILSENGAAAKQHLAASKAGVTQAVITGAGQRAEQYLVGTAGVAAGVLVILGGALGMQVEVLGQGGQLVPVGLSDRAVLEDDDRRSPDPPG